MNNLAYGVIFLLLALAGITLRKTYFAVPEHELKRRAETSEGDEALLYKAVAYGNSLRALLWIYIGLVTAASFVFLAKYLPIWGSLLIVAPLIYLIFSFIPATRVGVVGRALARIATPGIAWLMNYIHPPLRKVSDIVAGRYVPGQHTGLYERYDYLSLLDKQRAQPDSRLTPEEADTVSRALTFTDKRVSDVLTGRKKVKTLLADDTVGPILINDLHESSQEYVLVKDSKKGQVIGTLAFKGLGISSHGKVRDHMDPTLYYLNEDDSLIDALQAHFTTGQSMFVVVNSSEEYVGIVTLDKLIREMIGELPEDDFATYNSITAVASRHKATKNHELEEAETEVPDDQPTVKTEGEMVE